MKRAKAIKVALPARKARPVKVQFGMMPLVIGVVTGMLAGLIVELIKGPHQIYMQIGGIAGIALGALVEGVRYAWRKWKRGQPS